MEYIYELFYAILSDTSSAEEKKQFEEMMTGEENKQLFDQVKKIWEQSATIRHFQTYDRKRAFYEFSQKIKNNKRIQRKYVTIAITSIAAGILFMIGLFSFFDYPYLYKSKTAVTFQTDLGNRSFIVLPDNTQVWLNSRSQIQYETDFGVHDRTVKLIGEGFFNVTHQEKPFNLKVNDLTIKVYGTKFNVSAYAEDQDIFTCLESGKISITKEGKAELTVEPGQLMTYNKNTSKFEIANVDVSKYSAWKENKMYMRGEPLYVLATTLERKYNIHIKFIPENLGREVHYTGVFSDENIEEVLDAISIASNLKYHKSGNEYEIRYNQN